jgi:hypothetical protein
MQKQSMLKLLQSYSFYFKNEKISKGAFILGLFVFLVSSKTFAQKSLDPAWLKLMRYNKTLFGYESEVDSKNYFFSKDGKNSPRLELNASLEAMLTKHSKDINKHPICQFPGRYLYLKREGLIERNFDLKQCTEYQTYLKKIDLKSISLIFSSYYINKPASAFGHTLLKMNSNRGNGNDFFSYGVDFSAQVTTSNPLMYGVMGILGGFYGRFTLLPYFLKLREYNDYESRDLWEFELNFTDDELELAKSHLWDMNNALFDYYYFTENCSYHVLRFIDAIVPDRKLMETQYSITAPVDTLFPLIEEKNLVKKINLRPSLQKRILKRVDELSNKAKKAFEKAKNSFDVKYIDKATLSNTQKIQTLDSLAEYIDYKYPKEIQLNTKTEKLEDVQNFKREILTYRASFAEESTNSENKVKMDKINFGHRSRRFDFTYTSRDNKQGITLQNRTALHHITDQHGDIFSDFSLEMGKINIDILEDEKVYVNKLELASVLALRPWTLLDKTFSWDFKVGLGNSDSYKEIVSPYLDIGLGTAHQLSANQLSYFSLYTSQRHMGKKTNENESLIGPRLSQFMKFDKLRIALDFAYLYDFVSQEHFNSFNQEVLFSVSKSKNLFLRGEETPRNDKFQLGLILYY